MRLSVVIPAWNEEARIGATLEAVASWLEAAGEEHEILVVDDGSQDATAERVLEVAARHPSIQLLRHERNRGKGAAVRTGVLAAQGDEVLFSDADLATPIGELVKLRAALGRGYDVAIGSRSVPGSDVQVRQHPLREFMGRTFNAIVQVLVLSGFSDTQCGFKLFRGEAARDLFSRATLDGFSFDVEILVLARGRYRVAEVPVIWRHIDMSKVSPGIDAARMLWDVARLKLKLRPRRVTR